MFSESQVQPTWNDEFKTAIRSARELASFLDYPLPDQPYSIFIPLNFAQKIKDAGEGSALWNQFVPHQNESNSNGLLDPIGDKVHAKDGGVIHRYQNRILFSPTTVCPVHCRYCFRKNELNNNEDYLKANTGYLIEHLKMNPNVDEVILTGGDPLILSNKKIFELLKRISELSQIKYLRIHTRTPIIIPSRIDGELIRILDLFGVKFETLNFTIHTNHKSELTEDVCEKLKLLSQSSVQLLSQSVLLKGVNNNATDLTNLFKKLNKHKVRAYYLHHPDQVKGAMHFYLSLEEGRKVYAKLRDQLPGWMIPHYVVDSPDGHGKSLAFNPESFEFSGSLIDRKAQLQTLTTPI